MSDDKKDKVDSFFDWVDKGVDKFVGRMSQVQTPEKLEKAEREERDVVQRQAEIQPSNRQLAANAEADIILIDDDDAETIIKSLREAAGIYRQRSTSSAIPERSRNIALANCAAAETIAEDIREKLSRGYHITLRK